MPSCFQRLWKAYTTLLRHNLPALADAVAPELYLLEWLYTAFAKAMPLDAACRVWDVFLRDGGTFLFNTALGKFLYPILFLDCLHCVLFYLRTAQVYSLLDVLHFITALSKLL